MGVSTDAILAYGYVSDEEGRLVPEEWVDEELVRRGHVNPWSRYPNLDPLSYDERRRLADEWMKENEKELDEWCKLKADIKQEFGVEVGSHCSGDCPMPYIVITESKVVAHRGQPQQVDVGTLWTGIEWAVRLDRFCEQFGVRKPHPFPKWFLMSDWS